MSEKNLMVNAIDFNSIKENFKTYLKQYPEYRDYDFEASSLSHLLNIFAYNTHYLGYYIKMILNESFIDSAVTRNSLYSKAKLVGYVPRGKRSSRALIKFEVTTDIDQEPHSQLIIIPRGTNFVSANSNNDRRIFNLIDDISIKNRAVNGSKVVYTSDEFQIFEGSFIERQYKVNNNILNQRYIIKDKDIDIDTLRVDVRDADGNINYFNLSETFVDIKRDSKVFYLSTNEEGLYEVFFGQDQFGLDPEHDSIIHVQYIKCSGSSGNGARVFTFNKPPIDPNTDTAVGNFEDFRIIVIDKSSTGAEEESIDNLRFSIPNHFKRQNRLVTEDDYRNIIINTFRNVDSINVWGGEENYFKEYGKIFISLKPLGADRLTGAAKTEIKKTILEKFGIVGMELVFEDPEFIDLDLDVSIEVNFDKTYKSQGEIEKQTLDRIKYFNENSMNKFDNNYNDVLLMKYIIEDDAIKSAYSRKVISKVYDFIYAVDVEHIILFGNEIELDECYSSDFYYGGATCHFKEVNGELFIFKNSEKMLTKSYGSVDHLQGVVKFTFPEFANTPVEYQDKQIGQLTFYTKPSNADIRSYLNNIVRINKIKIRVLR